LKSLKEKDLKSESKAHLEMQHRRLGISPCRNFEGSLGQKLIAKKKEKILNEKKI